MAVIYASPDTRGTQISQAIAGAMQQWASKQRVDAVQQALTDPNDPQAIQKAITAAGQDPTAQKALMMYLQAQQVQQKSKLTQSQIDKNAFETVGPGGQATIAEKQSTTAKNQATAEFDALKAKGYPDELAAKIANARAAQQRADAATTQAGAAVQRTNIERHKLAQQDAQFTDFQKRYLDPMGKLNKDFQEKAATEDFADPAVGLGDKYNLNSDPLNQSIARLQHRMVTKDIPVGGEVSVTGPGGMRMSVKGPTPLDDATRKEVGANLSSAQALHDIFTLIRDNKGDIHSGPVVGAAQEWYNKLKGDITQIDPSTQYYDELGHLIPTAMSSFSSSPRPGYQTLAFLQNIITGKGMNAQMALDRVYKSTRVVRNSTAALVGAAADGNKALDPQIPQDIEQYTHEVMKGAGASKKFDSGEKPDKAGFVEGETYTDGQGNKAIYKGNGQWEEVK